MKALILAAGLGSRLNLDIPKPMFTIEGKPILEHNILLLKKHGIKDICITIHFRKEVIKNYFQDGKKWGVNIQYSYEEELLGTCGALRIVDWFLNNDPFLVIYGDNYTNINLTEMLSFHNKYKEIATIALFDPNKSLNSGIAGGVISLDNDFNITSFIEGRGNKDKTGYVNAGIYVLERKITDFLLEKVPSDFGKDLFPYLLEKKNKLKGYITDSFVLAIDTIDALKTSEEALKQGRIK